MYLLIVMKRQILIFIFCKILCIIQKYEHGFNIQWKFLNVKFLSDTVFFLPSSLNVLNIFSLCTHENPTCSWSCIKNGSDHLWNKITLFVFYVKVSFSVWFEVLFFAICWPLKTTNNLRSQTHIDYIRATGQVIQAKNQIPRTFIGIDHQTHANTVVGFRSLVEEESTYWTLVNSLNLQKWTDGCAPIRHQQNAAVFHFKLSFFYLHQISPLHVGLSHSPP